VTLAVLNGLSAPAAASSVSVQSFVTADWQSSVIAEVLPTYSGRTSNFGAVASGGNTGAYWSHSYQLTTSTHADSPSLRLAMVLQTFTYDPTLSGALLSLTLGFDTMGLSGSGGSGSPAGFLTPLLEQNGRFYRALAGGITPFEGDSWQAHDYTSSSASDWVEYLTNATPDFSATAGALHFGYGWTAGYACNSSTGCPANEIAAGLDNWRLTVNAADVPEPTSLALVIAALAGMGGAARRRQER
jgi:hypothetical protein